MEYDAVNYHGMLDVVRLRSHKQYPRFEEAVCELQKVRWDVRSESKNLAFGLNLCKLMIRYAFIKIGIPLTEEDRLCFLSNVKFNLGGHLFSLHEFINGILRGNVPSTFVAQPFLEDDPRLKHSIKLCADPRLLYAIYGGHEMGCQSSVPFDFYYSSKVDKQLNQAALAFWRERDHLSATPNSSTINITEVMGWYRSDFPARDNDWLKEISAFLDKDRQMLLPDWKNERLEVDFTECNWAGNYSQVERYNKDNLKGEVKGLKAFMKRFKQAPIPQNEVHRLKALRDLKVLDTLKEERFDRITRMVKHHFGAPIVAVTLVDANRQWFKSTQWFCPDYVKDAPPETGRDISFCSHVVHQEKIMVIRDTLRDDRFADNPVVTGDMKIRFYAGYPLMVPSEVGGQVCIGTLCLLDQKSRYFSKKDEKDLGGFANQVKKEILRRDHDECWTLPLYLYR